VSRLQRLALIVLLLLGPASATARTADEATHPALWHVQGPKGEIYLFGSIHILPADVEWQKGVIADAIRRSDVFVFEIPLDESAQAKLDSLIADRGQLPKGESLHALLPPAARADLDADAALAGLSPRALDGIRPWLAELMLVTSRMAKENASPESGVDVELEEAVRRQNKELRYLETVDQQINLIVPSDRKLELSEFEASLKEFRTEKDSFPELIKAWRTGDTKALDELLNGEFKNEPEARRALLDDRNRAWLPKLEGMLNEKKVFFVTVGAGHLMGRHSVPDLLRVDGYRVDGP
jgi:uncharacterized protein YbaP (TraB family)